MIDEFLNPVKLIIVITLLFAIFKLKWKNPIHRLVVIILLIDFLTEFINSLLITVFELPYKNVVLINVIIQHCLWLCLMGLIIVKKKTMLYCILFFLSFAIINFLFIQGVKKFNYYTFIAGAFIYLLFFFIESFHQLKKENFGFIFSNNYILLTSPIMFLFGMSLMFAFVSKEVTQTKVFLDMKLYNIIGNYVNIICYSLICIYIYQEIKIKNGK
jgi:hypothetical protein